MEPDVPVQLVLQGYVASMSDYESDQLEAIQGVVDRVAAYQDGAPDGTVEDELRKGFDEAGVDVSADDLEKIATAINEQDGDISAAAALG